MGQSESGHTRPDQTRPDQTQVGVGVGDETSWDIQAVADMDEAYS